MKLHYLFITSLVFLITGNWPQYKPEELINLNDLSGDITLKLEDGVWKEKEGKPSYQEIIIDLKCNQGNCDEEIWGYSPRFHQDVEHQGSVKVIEAKNHWKLKVNLPIQYSPWKPEEKREAEYTIVVNVEDNKLTGKYTGSLNERIFKGEVIGVINTPWEQSVENYQPLLPREHPRLIFRTQELPAIRKKSQTDYGQKIIKRLEASLNQEIEYDGIAPNGGYHAAGNCFLALINEDYQKADKAWEIIENSLANPGSRYLERSSILSGVALAYDLCYQLWDEEKIQRLTRWLARESLHLTRGDTPQRGWNGTAWSNWQARASGAAGLAALAILKEPEEYLGESTNPERLVTITKRRIHRYTNTALGNRAFGTEGDLYTRESLHSILPFVQAYQEIYGKDLVRNSNLAWVMPHYLTRMVGKEGDVNLSTYGRHRLGPAGDLFSFGWRTTPQEFLPAVLWSFEEYFALKEDESFGISLYQPHQAIYMLVGYPEDLSPIPPEKVFNRVLVDSTKGFFVFRNQWQNDQDFVSSIYLRRQPLGASWSFPDVGSFRIWGLGERWAQAGASIYDPEEENVVVIPEVPVWESAEPFFFAHHPDGSGIVSMKMKETVKSSTDTRSSPPLNATRSFAVDYSGSAGVPGLFVIADYFWNHLNQPSKEAKTWIMHTEGDVQINGQSFTITADSQATMQGTFITPADVKITYEKTETGGVIKAQGNNSFWVVMTVQSGSPPSLNIEGVGLKSRVKVGEQVITFGEKGINLKTLSP